MADDITIDAEQLEDFLNNASKYIEWAAKVSIEQASEFTLDKMRGNYAASRYEPGDYMDFSKTGTDTEKEVCMSGPQAVYSEFGTGTEGAMQPHPMKGDFELNDYNSGRTIRTATDETAKKALIAPGTLYWTFKDDEGNLHYTQGIPAQKIVYNAGIEVKKQMPEIIEKNLRRIFE
jgi:hypothetical protein